ncbi:hypothetical protein EYZ11_005943 [Aspergillus tanneri]|uniref:Uncharacterized protein n=1 Tax=Aspergillus tanneri TaxID=1220188 RepID=A0A4S3JGU3_9EURO|nr:hypothetical protein EYZ11_005943 [Aspergillus tanneri]
MAQSSQQRDSRHPRPVRSSRTKVRSYHEDSSSEDRHDENTVSDEDGLARLSLSLRPRDSNRMPTSYREESTDTSDGSLTDDPEAVIPVEAPTHHTYPFPEPAGRSSGVVPPWQTLPYHILFDILLYASYPLVDEKSMTRNNSVQWLVNMSLLCRAFHEPALAALYQCPPLLPAAKSHGLLNLLSWPQENLSTNYVNKVRELHVDVETLLLYKSGPTLGYFELPKLIEKTPRAKRLRLYHSDDYVIGLPSWQISRSKWTYPESLFLAIESGSMRLRSWDWNSRFMETKRLLPLMIMKHLQPAFQSLTELRLLHIASEESDDDDCADGSDAREVVLATALKGLPYLHHLQFIECSIVNEYLLPNLPTTLSSLTINNCDEVTTVNFNSFLATHGHHLRELNLCHNRHLSLSFIVSLAQSCQNLERFKMDVSMHDWSSYHDVEPHFKELLSPSEIPTWPASLQDIELVQLRKWDDRTAGIFFTSLIDAASELRDLRRLVISAILKIGWRDRASFREKWIGKLEKVFLRRSSPPDSTLRTIVHTPIAVSLDRAKTSDDGAAQSDAADSGLLTPSKRKSARLARRKLSEIEDNANKSPPGQAANEGDDDQNKLFMQGMCDIVSVRIDNQRPTETQFNEQDFLDDELSGDEDWNGHDLDVGDTSHAW